MSTNKINEIKVKIEADAEEKVLQLNNNIKSTALFNTKNFTKY